MSQVDSQNGDFFGNVANFFENAFGDDKKGGIPVKSDDSPLSEQLGSESALEDIFINKPDKKIIDKIPDATSAGFSNEVVPLTISGDSPVDLVSGNSDIKPFFETWDAKDWEETKKEIKDTDLGFEGTEPSLDGENSDFASEGTGPSIDTILNDFESADLDKIEITD